jgi:hypothetical protein
MVYEKQLPMEQYGFDVYSQDARKYRVAKKVSAKWNIATFHFVPRPGVVPTAPDPSKTVSSTGIGVYATVGFYVQHNIRINTSHSEHQFIEYTLKPLLNQGNLPVFPAQYVIDWVYTERAACPDVFLGTKFVAKGCRSELEGLENVQRSNHWDAHHDPSNKYGLRDDLKITIYSSFDGSLGISGALVFAPIRQQVMTDLYYELLPLFHREYEALSSPGEYDLDWLDRRIPESARHYAKGLASWDDYTFTLTEDELFEKALREHAAEIKNNVATEIQQNIEEAQK